jgi:predicted RND superfamily exporter protein
MEFLVANDNNQVNGLPKQDGSGPIVNAFESLFFKFRPLWLALFALATLGLGWQASQIRADASFLKMIPTSHPYIENYLENRAALAALGNSIRIIVANNDGDIFTAEYQDALRQITDEVFLNIEGVDKGGLESLWTPNVRWSEVTEEGFVGGTVVPDTYDGSAESLEQLRNNVLRSGQVGRLVANDFRSSIILAPILDENPSTGERLDYRAFSRLLEERLRDAYQTDTISIHIVGFTKVVGDLIEGASQVATFFGIAFLITLVLLFAYSRCYFATAITLLCSTIAVVWQLGLLRALGFGLDPYSMLVPFLVFAIGISHGVQMVNTIAIQSTFGATPEAAARETFRRLCAPGLIALVSDGIGFLTLRVIDIPVIKELAVTASLGIGVLILTNLVLLPLLMSYTGVSKGCVRFYGGRRGKPQPLWQFVSNFSHPTTARITVAVAAVLFVVGLVAGRGLQIGDLDPGAPELRPDSRYNQDNAYLTSHYSTSTDVFVVMVQTESQQCGSYQAVTAMDRLQTELEGVPGVQSAVSLVNVAKLVNAGMNEGNLKWAVLSRNRLVLNNSTSRAPSALMNTDCSMAPVLVFLDDHKAATLRRVVAATENFAERYNADEVRFELAAGNAGVEAATNMVIGRAQYEMLAWVYGVVAILCLITFRSIRVVACIILPLALTSVLAQALMAWLGIGVKVATLPVIALGVGIGVDYGIYIWSRLDRYLRRGLHLREAYYKTLKTTGTAVAFTGFTLAVGVGTWIFSPIKFQADMGIMLTFMFLWNMLGALILLPALARLLIDLKHYYDAPHDAEPASLQPEPT